MSLGTFIQSIFGAPEKPAQKPATPKGTTGAPYKPNQYDATEIRIDRVTGREITRAIDSAKLGDMRPCADINDAIRVHPLIGGIIDQRIAGLQGVQFSWKEPNDSSRAADILAMTEELLKGTDPAAIQLKKTSAIQSLRGGGLAQNAWGQRGGVWVWQGAEIVVQQRMRYDTETRRPAFAADPNDWQGVPITSFEPGTFLYFPIHEDLAHFGYRGYLRRLYSAWYDGNRVGATWAYKIHRWDDPPIHVATNSEDEKIKAEQLGKIGPGVVFCTNVDTKVSPIQVANSTGSEGSSHHEYLSFTVMTASVCLLGATQMVAVQTKEGSQNSAPGHSGIREDIIQADADTYAAARTEIALHLAVRNFGPDAAADAPQCLPDWKLPVDVGKELDNAKKADELGMEIGLNDLHEKTGITRPAPGVETVRGQRMGLAPGAPNVLPFAPKGAKP